MLDQWQVEQLQVCFSSEAYSKMFYDDVETGAHVTEVETGALVLLSQQVDTFAA